MKSILILSVQFDHFDAQYLAQLNKLYALIPQDGFTLKAQYYFTLSQMSFDDAAGFILLFNAIEFDIHLVDDSEDLVTMILDFIRIQLLAFKDGIDFVLSKVNLFLSFLNSKYSRVRCKSQQLLLALQKVNAQSQVHMKLLPLMVSEDLNVMHCSLQYLKQQLPLLSSSQSLALIQPLCHILAQLRRSGLHLDAAYQGVSYFWSQLDILELLYGVIKLHSDRCIEQDLSSVKDVVLQDATLFQLQSFTVYQFKVLSSVDSTGTSWKQSLQLLSKNADLTSQFMLSAVLKGIAFSHDVEALLQNLVVLQESYLNNSRSADCSLAIIECTFSHLTKLNLSVENGMLTSILKLANTLHQRHLAQFELLILKPLESALEYNSVSKYFATQCVVIYFQKQKSTILRQKLGIKFVHKAKQLALFEKDFDQMMQTALLEIFQEVPDTPLLQLFCAEVILKQKQCMRLSQYLLILEQLQQLYELTTETEYQLKCQQLLDSALGQSMIKESRLLNEGTRKSLPRMDPIERVCLSYDSDRSADMLKDLRVMLSNGWLLGKR
ncbi:hypothetical protein MIR68_006937 [Amoeboaphelidium protococcarum]|nr:hypothetical protein MIR68_006937 [Amoeboaphelidium protococcarum]